MKYTYECAFCGEFDDWHSVGKRLKRCPKCNAHVKRVYKPTIVNIPNPVSDARKNRGRGY